MTCRIRILLVIASLVIVHNSYSQKSSIGGTAIPLTDLKTPNSPCFQVLDIAPSSVEHPANPKEFALNITQLIGSGSALPKNFAVEVAPYWYFKHNDETVYKYLNLPDNTGRKYIFGGVLRKMSFSLASTFSDSTSGSLLKKTNYFAVGLRTNVLTIRNPKDSKHINDLLNIISSRLRESHRGDISPDSSKKELARDSTYLKSSSDLQNAINGISIPLFQLDAAYAYSDAFAGNAIGGYRFNRTAAWLTATFSTPLNNKQSNNLSILALIKLLRDNTLQDTAHNTFSQKSAFDIGGKLSYSNQRFTLGIEFVDRTYSGDAALNSNRCVGLAQYKVNDNLFLTVSFGQNFGTTSNNLFSLIGLNFGFGNKGESLPD